MRVVREIGKRVETDRALLLTRFVTVARDAADDRCTCKHIIATAGSS